MTMQEASANTANDYRHADLMGFEKRRETEVFQGLVCTSWFTDGKVSAGRPLPAAKRGGIIGRDPRGDGWQ